MLQKFNKRNRRLNWGHMSTVFYRSDNICYYSLGLFPRKFRDLKPRYRIVGFIIENGTNLNPSEGDIKDIPGGLYQFACIRKFIAGSITVSHLRKSQEFLQQKLK